MINFPRWSDLGVDPGTAVIDDWESMLQRLQRYHYYYEGQVFTETVKAEMLPPGTEPPLLFPIGINLVKMLCIAQADAMFGEWDEVPFQLVLKHDEEIKNPDTEAINMAKEILHFSDATSLFWELEMDRNMFGGAAIKITPLLSQYPHVKWTRVPRNGFFPIWDPTDPNDLLEVWFVTQMTPSQAQAKYGIVSSRDVIYRVEHWTKTTYQTFVDDVRIGAYSGTNPWGVVPFVYIPRYRTNRWWGEALTEEIIPVQDELNMRIADVGEAISYNSHPIRWGLNMPKSFNADNYTLAPNAFWDMGRAIDKDRAPQVGIMEASAAVASGVFDHIEFLYDWARTAANSPPIAFGEDNGGGQRSGITLEIRMWPLLRAIRRSRGFLTTGINRALHITGRILEQKRYTDVPIRAIERFAKGQMLPSYYAILPRDQQAIVDEVVKLLSTNPPQISTETSQKILGRGVGETTRIKNMLKDKEQWKEKLEPPGQEEEINIKEKE